MIVTVILAHPHQGSFNHAIADTVITTLTACGHTVRFHDLYQEHFDPILPYEEIQRDASLPPDIARHCLEISAADGIVIIHPDWWGQPPAILKGWVDRVLRPQVAYRFQEGDNGQGIPLGLLKAKTAFVFNTSNTPDQREKEVFGDPLGRLWKDCILSFCGVPVFNRRVFSVVVTSTPEERKGWLDEVSTLVKRTFPQRNAKG
ncbi:MAG: NAD(P)H-dependent oxidoreductase [Methanoregula sp.]